MHALESCLSGRSHQEHHLIFLYNVSKTNIAYKVRHIYPPPAKNQECIRNLPNLDQLYTAGYGVVSQGFWTSCRKIVHQRHQAKIRQQDLIDRFKVFDL